jgi:predicted ATPase/DNA-binding CsgD family transcriptional regulator
MVTRPRELEGWETAERAPRSQGSNLPAELSAFIGRRQLLVQARASLIDRRLLTLSGVGGVGKTRLALRVASSLRRSFQDGGVWFVELGSLREPDLVTRAVADVLQVPDQGRRPLAELVVDRLVESRALLVLDNCEHLLEGTAALAELLLGACPRLHVLATSRQALGVDGETVLTVPPLPMADARQLFLERAAAACSFTPEPGQEAAIDELCEQLDRLPLALELAAGRLKTISIAEMLARMESGFGLRDLGRRRGVERQQTLRATLDWSHDLLDEREQAAWRRLATFESGFRLAGAEALLGDDALDLVGALVDKSILGVEQRDDHTWYRMLETVRRYGQARLEASGERPDMERRLVELYLTMAEDADRRQSGPEDDPSWAAELDEEQGNLRRALAAAGRLGGDHRLRMAVALVAYWDLRGQLEEGRRWLASALALGTEDANLMGKALDGAGWLTFRQNDYASAESYFERARAVAEAASDAQVLARADSNLGLVRIMTGRTDEAEAYLRASIRTAREAGLPAEEVGPLMVLALLHYVSGDPAAAVGHAQSCLDVARRLRNLKTVAMAVGVLGNLNLELGDVAGARSCLDEALGIAARIGDRINSPLILGASARLAELEGDHERCLTLAAAAGRLERSTGAGPMAVWQWRVDQAVDRARTALGPYRADAAWSRGAAVDSIEAVLAGRGQAPEPARKGLHGGGEVLLTRREMEVATLVADGLSNRAIAERLIIGQRTVETHVENILNKLGFHSRAEIAVWAARRAARS